MKQKALFLAISLALFSWFSPAAAHEDHVFLESELLKFADDKPFGIHAEYIGFMLQIIREINEILDGKKATKGAQPRGIFTLQSAACSIRQLRMIEAEIEAEIAQLTASNDAKKQPKIDALLAKKSAIKTCLEEAIKYFAAKILPFNDHARGVQKLIVALIEESCIKRNRKDSFILTWGECPEGKELEVLTKQLVTIKQFDTFLTDLVNFLKDIIYSCPKARASFMALVKQKMSSADNHQ